MVHSFDWVTCIMAIEGLGLRTQAVCCGHLAGSQLMCLLCGQGLTAKVHTVQKYFDYVSARECHSWVPGILHPRHGTGDSSALILCLMMVICSCSPAVAPALLVSKTSSYSHNKAPLLWDSVKANLSVCSRSLSSALIPIRSCKRAASACRADTLRDMSACIMIIICSFIMWFLHNLVEASIDMLQLALTER